MKHALILYACCLLFLSACDVETESEVTANTGASTNASTEAGDLLTEERDVSDFNRVRLETLGDLSITQGDETSVVLELSPKYEGVIETDVEGDTLVISSNRRNLTQVNRDVLRYTVTMPELEAVQLGGSGDINVGSFSAEDILLAVDGSGDIVAEDLRVERLELAIDGSSNVRLTGRADTFTVGIDGAGEIDAQDFRAQEVRLGISGAGEAEVCALETLNINVSGSGEVTYYGEPSEPNVDISGAGEVEAGGDCP